MRAEQRSRTSKSAASSYSANFSEMATHRAQTSRTAHLLPRPTLQPIPRNSTSLAASTRSAKIPAKKSPPTKRTNSANTEHPSLWPSKVHYNHEYGRSVSVAHFTLYLCPLGPNQEHCYAHVDIVFGVCVCQKNMGIE